MPRGHHYAWGATFEKVDETTAQASANNTQTNQNLNLKKQKAPDISRELHYSIQIKPCSQSQKARSSHEQLP